MTNPSRRDDTMSSRPAAPSTSDSRPIHARWGTRVRDTLSTYLPLMLMFLLALATWWLARNAPQPEAPRVERAPAHEPDYLMHGVLLQRFDPRGSLRVAVTGDVLRHYPDDDSVEVDNVRIDAFGRDDRETVATARLARTTSKADELRLEGGAHVRSQPHGAPPDVDFSSEFLHVLVDARRVRTHLPVTLRAGGNDVRAAGLEYTEQPQHLELRGPLHAVVDTAERPTRKPAPKASP